MGKIARIRERLERREVSCAELTQSYLDEIEQKRELNAYVRLTADEAMAAAARTDEKIARGEKLLPLEGVPMALKDNISTTGIETTCCSRMLEGYTPIYDATVYKRLKDMGAVMLGKANMDEFAMGSTTENSCYGPVLNPVNKEYVPGGSSGGSAAAVAADLAAYALGTDTGGSIRQPSAFCGVVGLKPTYGSISRYGLVAFASSLDQIGPIAPTAADVWEVYHAICGHDPMDSTSLEDIPAPVPLTGDVKGLKLALLKEGIEGSVGEVREAVLSAARKYEKLGAIVEEVSMPQLDFALPTYYVLACAEASSNLGRFDSIRFGSAAEVYGDVNDLMSHVRGELFGAEVKRRIMLGTYVLSSGYYDAYYSKAQRARGVIIKVFKDVFEKYDAVLSPTTPIPAFKLGLSKTDAAETHMTDILTVPANIAGLPAVSAPCGTTSAGLPIGMQLIGPRLSEDMLLNAVHAYEGGAGDEI